MKSLKWEGIGTKNLFPHTSTQWWYHVVDVRGGGAWRASASLNEAASINRSQMSRRQRHHSTDWQSPDRPPPPPPPPPPAECGLVSAGEIKPFSARAHLRTSDVTTAAVTSHR